MGSVDSGPYDPDLDVHQHINPSEPEPLPFTSSPMPRSPPPVWPAPVNSDYPNFYAQPIDENDVSYMEYFDPSIFQPNSTSDELRNNNDNDNYAENHHANDNNATPTGEGNSENRRNNNSVVIRGDDIIVGASNRNDVLEIIDLVDESNHAGANSNAVNDGDEKITTEMVSELLGDTGAFEEYMKMGNDRNANNGKNVEENVDGRDKGKAVVIEPEEAADVNVFGNVVVGDGTEGGAGTSAGPSGTGRIMFHQVRLGSLDCRSCNVAGGLYSTDDPRFQARISVHGLNGLYHHMIFEFQNADPALAQEVQMFIFDMYGLPMEKINEYLAYYHIQMNQNGQIELHETFLNIYVAICGQGLLSSLDSGMSNGPGEGACDEQTVLSDWDDFAQTRLHDEQTVPAGPNINYQLNQGDGRSRGQQPTYNLEVLAPLPIRTAPHPLAIGTAPRPLMLDAPLPNYNNHYQHPQQHHHYNHNAMQPYHHPSNALPHGVSGYLPPPDWFAVGPSNIHPSVEASNQSAARRSRNRSMEPDPLSFLDNEIPDWMRGASSPEPEEEDDETTPSRPTIGVQRERTANMSLLDLAKYFHVKAEKASSKLQVCSTTLKIVCRKKGLKRWPYRQIRSIDNKIIGLKRMVEEHKNKGDNAAMLTAERDLERQRNRRIQLYISILTKMRDNQEEDNKQEDDYNEDEEQ